ncbi:MAG: TonB-dependent receptor [Hyphomicrobiales bacterium]|nr:TonB-dependent receptor [Hyphomicrobiales bacterium]
MGFLAWFAPHAWAQDSVELPNIDVTSSRLGTKPPRARSRPSQTEAVSAESGQSGGQPGDVVVERPSGIATRTTITGASTTVLTSTDIERNPGQTVQDLLSREPGIQVRSLYGGVNGTQSSVDMRGFGANATSNTLILINGRRLNDVDLAGIDLSTLPRESIDHIEITRGNSGAVLYGDGAVGGVINIVTKTGTGLPRSARVSGTFGAFRYAEGTAGASGSWGPWAVSAYGNAISSDGYRQNNQLQQQNAVGDIRYSGDQGGAYLNLSADKQHLGFPGGRLVTPSFSLVDSDPRGATTPYDYGDKQGVNVTAGVTRILAPGTELIVDGGVRQKKQQAGFFSPFGPLFDSYVDTSLTTYSLTPRIISNHAFGDIPGKLVTGIDVYQSIYGSDRDLHRGDPPYHRYDLRQLTAAVYAMETMTVRPGTDVGAGIRVQQNRLTARDRLDPNAPGALFAIPEGLPFDGAETQQAWHLGVNHRINQELSVFARMARSFRVPNVDERVGVGPFGVPTNFDLRTQTSRDYEAGVRAKIGKVEAQVSAYLMNLQNEIFFSPASFTNVNLDPTRRYGVEAIGSWQATPLLMFKLGLAHTRAIFVEGPFAGNDIPLVARWTESIGVSWNIYRNYLVLDAAARLVGSRRMDNDSANIQELIPANTLVDIRIGGTIEKLSWALSVQNLFDVHYFDYAISRLDFITGLPAVGFYSAYPLPGRTFMVKLGMTF